MATRDQRLSAFKQDGFPPPDTPVQVLCEDKSGTYVPPFNCIYADGKWYGANQANSLEVTVVGWKIPSPVYRRGY